MIDKLGRKIGVSARRCCANGVRTIKRKIKLGFIIKYKGFAYKPENMDIFSRSEIDFVGVEIVLRQYQEEQGCWLMDLYYQPTFTERVFLKCAGEVEFVPLL